MPSLKISLVSLGSLKYPVNISKVEHWRSRIFTVFHGASVNHLPNAQGQNWSYPNEQLIELIRSDERADITVGLINAPLEDNYYMRRLDNKIAVLSLYEMGEILGIYNLTIENYILRNLYELAVLYSANGCLFPFDAHSWAHDDVRGCLFDMNASKLDIVFSMHKPILCDQCKGRVLKTQIDPKLLPALNKELPRLTKALYFRISEWVKRHPLYAVCITAVFAIFLNILASIMFEKLKGIMSGLT